MKEEQETMAVYDDREAFIPYRRTDLIELCIEDGKLPAADHQKFRGFCEILSAFYHFKFHRMLEILKDNFAPFNPDSDTKSSLAPTPQQSKEMEEKLVETFEAVLRNANYQSLSEGDLQRAFEEKSLVDVKTHVDFNDFERMVFYYRGDLTKTISVKKFFKTMERQIGVFERVVLLIKFKDAAYFEAKKKNLEHLKFTPSKTYIYYYKNIPRFDLDLLFPNVEVSMSWKDRLLFGLPAVTAAVSVAVKALPKLILIVGVILFFTVGPSLAERLAGVNQKAVNDIMFVLTALLSLVVGLGGFALKQYSSYKTKVVKFQKNVTDTLFFRCLGCNETVFQSLIDSAEEEECKEIILVYYYLLTHSKPLTRKQLDDQIEMWMEEKFGVKIDFDINGPLQNLAAIRGRITKDETLYEIPLISFDSQGNCCVIPLDDAKEVIDHVWDNLFQYSSGRALRPRIIP
jgi:hypothetical protein